MIVPEALFTLALWGSVGAVAAGAAYLLVILLKEWRAGDLW